MTTAKILFFLLITEIVSFKIISDHGFTLRSLVYGVLSIMLFIILFLCVNKIYKNWREYKENLEWENRKNEMEKAEKARAIRKRIIEDDNVRRVMDLENFIKEEGRKKLEEGGRKKIIEEEKKWRDEKNKEIEKKTVPEAKTELPDEVKERMQDDEKWRAYVKKELADNNHEKIKKEKETRKTIDERIIEESKPHKFPSDMVASMSWQRQQDLKQERRKERVQQEAKWRDEAVRIQRRRENKYRRK